MRNLIKHGLVLVSLVSIASMVACGGDEKPAQDPSAMNTPPMPESTPAATDARPVETVAATPPEPPAKPADKPLTDAEIIAVTSTANAGEIEMAELAKKAATNAEVKNYAAMMIAQHRDLEAKGKTLATKAKMAPAENEASTALKSEVEATLASLKTHKGKEFDKAYMAAEVKLHKDVLSVVDNKLLPNAQNGELKALLNDTRTHVAAHAVKAEEISGKLDSATATTPAKPTTPAKQPVPKK